MKVLYFSVALIAASGPTWALAQTPQIAPTRVEFTRPGGTPGMARGVVRPSEVYMIAPAQPEAVRVVRSRKKR
jgi:hypothetical protein